MNVAVKPPKVPKASKAPKEPPVVIEAAKARDPLILAFERSLYRSHSIIMRYSRISYDCPPTEQLRRLTARFDSLGGCHLRRDTAGRFPPP